MDRYLLQWQRMCGDWETVSGHAFLWRACRLAGLRVSNGTYVRRWRVLDSSNGKVRLEVHRVHPGRD
jgi:hypothetical protein